jgi:gamma-glutamyl hercynylcysteine S-oxide synthase
MRHNLFGGEPSREELIEWYRRTRARTRELFDLIPEDAYHARPIPLRNPIVFYEGHLPAFAVNTLVKLTLGRKGVDERLESLFERGIDPADEAAVNNPTSVWPSRAEVRSYGAAAEALFEEHVDNCEAAFTVIEHELMHQETLLYIVHALGSRSAAAVAAALGPYHSGGDGRRTPRAVQIPAGIATLGQEEGFFGWDNEFGQHTIEVPAFEIDSHNVTNADYAEYVEATGAPVPHFLRRDGQRWLRKTMFGLEPMPENAPVYVTHDEAAGYARWKGKRLPTEAEWHRAATGAPLDGNFGFAAWDPVEGSSGPSEFGVYDLIGNGWEWTSTLFAPFPRFKPMASYLPYSTDFFDGAHYVMKGASPVTPRELVRPSFRNWFRPNYPWVFATFRLVR